MRPFITVAEDHETQKGQHLSVNSMSHACRLCILSGSLLTAAFPGYAAGEPLESSGLPPGKAVSIAVSRNLPVVGEPVTVRRLALEATTCEITDPQGGTQTLSFDAQAKTTWLPTHYGPHRLRCGDKERRVWVLAAPMWFHWWDGRTLPQNANVVMGVEKGSEVEWKNRGVSMVGWVVGEYAHRTSSGYKPPYTVPEQWVKDWLKAKEQSTNTSGFAMDEVFCANEEPSPAIVEAVAQFRKLVGLDYLITIYTSGAERGFDKSGRLLRESKALCMTESYYGDEKLFAKRWQDMKQYGLENQTLFAIGPGFKLRPDCHGPLTEQEVKAEFAKVRRVAPESPGIAIYNAFSLEDRVRIQPALDEACSHAVEDFYLKPVPHVSANQKDKARQAALWNIGNDDAKGFAVEWLDAHGVKTAETLVPILCPQERKELTAPAGAVSLKLRTPEGMANLYSGPVKLPR
jgi:hypothetical protein